MTLKKERSVVKTWTSHHGELLASAAHSRRVLSQLITRGGKAELTGAPFLLAHHLGNPNTLGSEVGENSRTPLPNRERDQLNNQSPLRKPQCLVKKYINQSTAQILHLVS